MLHPGVLTAFALAALTIASLIGLAKAGSGGSADLAGIGPYLTRVVFGASLQAGLSTVLSLALGSALALALNRRQVFAGRRLLTALMAATTVAPVIVIVYGVVAVYGRSGLAGDIARLFGLGAPPAIFGLHGIIIAHLLMNAPFVARALLQALGRQPGTRLMLGAALGFSIADTFRHIDWPVLRRELPGLATLVFLLCFTSFAVVLTLGGGPKNATLEVAIYEALRVEADFGRAAGLAALQFAICLGLTALLAFFNHRPAEAAGGMCSTLRPDSAARGLKAFDGATILLGTALIAPPLLAVLAGVPALPRLATSEVLEAALTSALLALAAGLIAVTLALALASPVMGRAQPWRGRAMDLAALAMLGLPPFAFVTGLYVLLRGLGNPAALGLLLVPLVNGLMALPFAYRLISPPLALNAERHGRLAQALGLTGLTRLRLVDWPVLRAPLLAAFAMAMALSLGDFGVIALFGGGDLITLPYLLADRLGSYRSDEAAALALLLVLTAGLLAYAADRGSAERHA
jgi:thiamine transport system permease protein